MESRPGITVLAFFDRISVFHTLAPYLVGLHGPEQATAQYSWPPITYTDSPKWCLAKDKNDYLIIERMFLKPPVTDIELLRSLRQRYRRIFFFNGNAGGAIQRPEVLPYVDRFYNKAVFVERTHYTTALYGRELFTDYYHRGFGVKDQPEIEPSPAAPRDLQKIYVGWNIGVGDFPRRHFRQRVGVALSRLVSPRLAAPLIHRREMTQPSPPQAFAPVAEDRENVPGPLYDVNARLGNPGYNSIAFHRRHLGAILDDAAREGGWRVARDRVSVRRYFSDMEGSAVTFSPFGWGELCFRDFEAVRAGSLLVKPDMSHVETWPDIYRPHETYVPVSWDGSDVAERIQHYLDRPREAREIARRAFEVYASQLAELPRRVAGVLRELVDG